MKKLILCLILVSNTIMANEFMFLLADKIKCDEALFSRVDMNDFGKGAIDKMYEKIALAVVGNTPDVVSDPAQVTIHDFISFKQNSNSTYYFDLMDDVKKSFSDRTVIEGTISALGKTTPIEIEMLDNFPVYPNLYAYKKDVNEYDVLGNLVKENPATCQAQFNRGVVFQKVIVRNSKTSKVLGESGYNDHYAFSFGEALLEFLNN